MTLAALLTVVLPAFGLAGPPSARAAGWERVQLAGPGGKAFLLSASCPSSNLCVAVGTSNLIASSTNPTGGAAAWSYGYAGDGPWPETESWPTAEISGKQIQSISCPSVSLCVAVTNQGNIYSTTNPTEPPSKWHVTSIDGSGANTHLFGVSCPTVTLCVAVSGKRTDPGKIFSSSNPDGGAGAWSSIEFGQPFEFRAVSCGWVSLCVAVADDGRIVTSTEPAGPASAWDLVGAPAGPGALRAVSCVAGALCVAGNQGGNILNSTDPAGGLSSWKETDGGGSVQITGAACPALEACILVDNNGDVISSTNPTGGKADWSFANVVPYTPAEGNGLFGATCPSTRLCLVTGARGQIFTDTDPFKAVKAAPPQQVRKHRRAVLRPHARIATIRLPFRSQIQHHNGRAMIRFYARDGARGFICSFDGRAFRRCRSPQRYRVGIGRHIFRVRAIGRTGLRGPVAKQDFRIYPLCKKSPPAGTGRRICF